MPQLVLWLTGCSGGDDVPSLIDSWQAQALRCVQLRESWAHLDFYMTPLPSCQSLGTVWYTWICTEGIYTVLSTVTSVQYHPKSEFSGPFPPSLFRLSAGFPAPFGDPSKGVLESVDTLKGWNFPTEKRQANGVRISSKKDNDLDKDLPSDKLT